MESMCDRVMASRAAVSHLEPLLGMLFINLASSSTKFIRSSSAGTTFCSDRTTAAAGLFNPR